MVALVSPRFSHMDMRRRACYRAAWLVRHMWEETGASDTRIFLEPTIHKDMFLVGESVNGGGRLEHVVPRVVLCHACHDLFARGRSIDEAASLLLRLLRVVRITPTEQHHIDHELGLKARMPEGWTLESGDPYARLVVGEIAFDWTNEDFR